MAAIDSEKPGSPRQIKLIRLRTGVMTATAKLAGKLRLTAVSTVDRYTPKIAKSGPKQWRVDFGDAG